jgi:hypothetical protein
MTRLCVQHRSTATGADADGLAGTREDGGLRGSNTAGRRAWHADPQVLTSPVWLSPAEYPPAEIVMSQIALPIRLVIALSSPWRPPSLLRCAFGCSDADLVLLQPRPSRSATEATDANGAGSAALTAAVSRLRWPAMAACRSGGSVDSSSSSIP